jgi:hypothetical protein
LCGGATQGRGEFAGPQENVEETAAFEIPQLFHAKRDVKRLSRTFIQKRANFLAGLLAHRQRAAATLRASLLLEVFQRLIGLCQEMIHTPDLLAQHRGR